MAAVVTGTFWAGGGGVVRAFVSPLRFNFNPFQQLRLNRATLTLSDGASRLRDGNDLFSIHLSSPSDLATVLPLARTAVLCVCVCR